MEGVAENHGVRAVGTALHLATSSAVAKACDNKTVNGKVAGAAEASCCGG